MSIRLFVVAALVATVLHAPLLQGQAAESSSVGTVEAIPEEIPTQTGISSTVLSIGLFATIVIGILIFKRVTRTVARDTGGIASVVGSPHIDTAPTPPPPSRPAAGCTVFISYRRADSADITGRIYDRLTDRFGKEHVYKDVDSVPLGVDFRKHVGDLVQQCDAVIAIIGNQWVSSSAGSARRLDDPRDLVRIEIAAALARGIPVVPVLVGGAAMPAEQELPQELQALAYRNGISVRPDPDFHKDLDRLIAGIDAHFARR